MTILHRILEKPRYGYGEEDHFYSPSSREVWSEFFFKLNIFRTKKNWLSLFGWVTSLSFSIPLFIFLTQFWSWKLALAGFFYSMVGLGSHGTFWLHRYSTHRAFKFRNPWLRALCRNLVIKVIPEEVYVISHHVHHHLSEKPGDPYNVNGGWLYCFLADVTHQGIHRALSVGDYGVLQKLMSHTGVRLNSFAQYQRWGTLCHPAWTILHYTLNWSFWYGIFYLLGGNALATALFGSAGVWAIGVRTFNFEGHGKGSDRRRAGIDFDSDTIAVNQLWPGFVAGEWHSNHHLYPTGARSGFLKYQIDIPWILIRSFHFLGIISSFKDYKREFFEVYFEPYHAALLLAEPPRARGFLGKRSPLKSAAATAAET